MTVSPNRSAKFRAALKAELPAWVQDGLLSAESAEQLNQRYQLDKLEKESSRLLAAVLFTLGSLLLGGGGLIRNLFVGIIGAILGGLLVQHGLLKLPYDFNTIIPAYGNQLVVSTVGAMLVIVVARFLGGR